MKQRFQGMFNLTATRKGPFIFCFENPISLVQTIDFDVHIGHLIRDEAIKNGESDCFFNFSAHSIKSRDNGYNVQFDQHWVHSQTARQAQGMTLLESSFAYFTIDNADNYGHSCFTILMPCSCERHEQAYYLQSCLEVPVFDRMQCTTTLCLCRVFSIRNVALVRMRYYTRGHAWSFLSKSLETESRVQYYQCHLSSDTSSDTAKPTSKGNFYWKCHNLRM